MLSAAEPASPGAGEALGPGDGLGADDSLGSLAPTGVTLAGAMAPPETRMARTRAAEIRRRTRGEDHSGVCRRERGTGWSATDQRLRLSSPSLHPGARPWSARRMDDQSSRSGASATGGRSERGRRGRQLGRDSTAQASLASTRGSTYASPRQSPQGGAGHPRPNQKSIGCANRLVRGYANRSGLTDSYHLFERCANGLRVDHADRARERIADVLEHRLSLAGADIAQR